MVDRLLCQLNNGKVMRKLIVIFTLFITLNANAYWPWVEEICFNPKCPKDTPIQFWEASKELKDRICEDYDASVWRGNCLSCNKIDYFRIKNKEECDICPNSYVGKTKDGSIYCFTRKGSKNG